MNKKDMSQLKKAIGKDEDGPILRFASCYVDTIGDNIYFQQPELFSRTDDEEAEQYRMFLKKAITGKVGSTLVELSPEKNELEVLKNTHLEDEEAIHEVCKKIKEMYPSDENYGIFLAYGAYDVPPQTSEGDLSYDDSDEVYEFVVITIQPCGLSKAGIVYDSPSNHYKDRKKDRPLGAPVHSFLYPSFDEGHSDISKAAYFSKNEKVQAQIHEVLDALFGVKIPLTAQEQKDGFAEMMKAGFGEAVPYDSLQKVYEKFSEIRAENESEGVDAKLTSTELMNIIRKGDEFKEEEADKFEEISETFEGKEFNLDNIAPKSISISTDTAKVKVDLNEMAGLDVIEHNGQRCLVVPLYGASIENIAVK